ncbi:MAG: phosphoribosylanthranilate isomerase [Chloroflexi bacterium]|nr:phosphoribosylanthranilate isomerase [Chloroflexota bacterium]
MTYIKICGLTRPEHVHAVLGGGVDAIGLMFAERSRRRVTVEQAKTLLAELPNRQEPPAIALPLPAGHTAALWFERCAVALEDLVARRRPLVVGVFADQPASLVNSIAEVLDLDLVQLSGNESWEDCLLIRRPVVKAERVAFGDMAGDILARAEAGTASMVLLDTAVTGELGGTGVRFDWGVGRRVAEALPVMLAGGLDPDNVAEAITTVRPWGVDVSGGVETDGTKDVEKIARFVAAARAADAARAEAGGGNGGGS